MTYHLDRLRDDLVVPILRQLALTEEQAAAIWRAPLVVVRTRPVAAQVLGWANGGPIAIATLTVEELPTAGMVAIADYLSAGLETLPVEARTAAVAAIDAERADVHVSLRPDRGEVVTWLVPRDERPPIELFRLVDLGPETRH